MKNFSKILIFFAIIGLFIFNNIFAVNKNIFRNNEVKNIEISENIKDKVFTSNENIILKGTSVPSKEIIIFLDNKVGLSESDKNGNWVINLGAISEGSHNFQVVTDNSDNSRSINTFHILVDNSSKSLFGNLTAAFSRIFFFNFIEKVKLYPRNK